MIISGIDPDTRALTLVSIADGGVPSRRVDIRRVEVKGRLAEDRFLPLVDALLESEEFHNNLLLSDWTYVERPMVGPNRKGAIDLGQIVGALRTVLHIWKVPHSMVGPGTWKKAVLGTGHAPKEEIKAWGERVLGLADDHQQDVYDAAAIAMFGIKGQEK